MFTKYKVVRRLVPQKDVNKPFKNASCQGRIHKFFYGGGAPNFSVFSSVFFSGRIALKQFEEQKRLCVDPEAMACSPGKFLKI